MTTKQPSKVVHVAGRRKMAIARATIREGAGVIRINHQPMDLYEPMMSRFRLMEPVMIAGDLSKKVNIDVNVAGGGFQAQTEASRLAIARALVEFSRSKELRKAMLEYDRHLLVADTRVPEQSKPNDSKPRRARQKSYR